MQTTSHHASGATPLSPQTFHAYTGATPPFMKTVKLTRPTIHLRCYLQNHRYRLVTWYLADRQVPGAHRTLTTVNWHHDSPFSARDVIPKFATIWAREHPGRIFTVA